MHTTLFISVLIYTFIVLCDSQRSIPNKSANKADSNGISLGPDGKYLTRYENINVDEILASKRLVRNYVDCLLGTKICTQEGQELKKILPDALKTTCAKCTDRQKEGALKVITIVKRDYPEEWRKLSEKWDPNGEYFKKFQDEQDKLLKNKHK